MLNLLVAAERKYHTGIPIAGPGRSSPADYVLRLIPESVTHFLAEWSMVWMPLMFVGILVFVLKYDPKDAR